MTLEIHFAVTDQPWLNPGPVVQGEAVKAVGPANAFAARLFPSA
jgi:hypothetical protein